ncbi:MAG: ABC transporter permease [Rhizobium sp.]|uniref:ABC transporter permease n=1 Tax=Rhizobium sp. SYY.PMSO TaxID=3382192 RepID=UPI00398FB113
MRYFKEFGHAIGAPLAAIVATLTIGFLLVTAITDEPVQAYHDLLFANFESLSNFGLFLNRATPLTLIALGVIFSFRAGVFNVGGEGQLYAGAIAAAVVAIIGSSLPGIILLPVSILAGIVAGAFLGWIPAILKVRLAVDEVVTTLMLNIIMLLLTSYLANNVIRDANAYGAVSKVIPKSVWLSAMPGVPGASISFLVAVMLAFATWILLFRTPWGARLRSSGVNLRFAEAIGVAADRYIISAMVITGSFGGLAGALYVLGIGHRFDQNFSPAYGLVGLTCALLARVHPLGALATSLFYAMMLNGAAYMQISTEVPRSLVNLLTGLLVLLMTARLRRANRL